MLPFGVRLGARQAAVTSAISEHLQELKKGDFADFWLKKGEVSVNKVIKNQDNPAALKSLEEHLATSQELINETKTTTEHAALNPDHDAEIKSLLDTSK